jgi:immune inhibitor A
VEWRTATKYDQSLRTAYVPEQYTPTKAVVGRAPYNIPAAVIYYRNSKYGFNYDLLSASGDAPSYGPKHQLLVVDVNPVPLRHAAAAGAARALIPGASSRDAGLTLQPAEAFRLNSVYGITGGPYDFAARPAVATFDDALGYYPGFFTGPPCDGDWCYASREGSAVIPARGNYTVRATNYAGEPATSAYGQFVADCELGTGNPKDSHVDWGVKIVLTGKAADDTTATLSFRYAPTLWTSLPMLRR